MNGKKLFRSENERIIAGIAGGLAQYFGTDPILIRIIFIFLAFMGGGGIALYILLWMFVPAENQVTEKADIVHEVDRHAKNSNRNVHIILGVFITLIGAMLLADNFLPFLSFSKIWPVFVVLFGILVLTGLI